MAEPASEWAPSIGAWPTAEGVHFRVWAPTAEQMEVVLYGPDAEALHPLAAEGGGYFSATIGSASPGSRYRYRIDGGAAYPDPASRAQPEGVHGPSQVVAREFPWTDGAWQGRSLEELVIYEVHVGTFTPEGTFDAALRKLPYLASLGVTVVEIMPIANFPGERNWGYDGVDLFAPATVYGGGDAFKRFIDAAHALRMAVFLDVVYNHLGPEGNYLPAITGGYFFTDRHHTPWGDAVNFDGPHSHGVRDLVIENALYWLHDFHLDGLRLDATHAILDDSRPHLLAELAERVHALAGRRRFLIAEDERHEPQLLRPPPDGYALDLVWADDLHHEIRRFTTGDREGYFAHYSGTIRGIENAYRYAWWRDDSTGRAADMALGSESADFAPARFVQCIQNHDQVGNRAFGERIHHQITPAVYRAISTLLLTAPSTPLLWMGQEWAASTPFLYFTDHPEELGRAVTRGRREEFGHFSAFRDPILRDRIPDPQERSTFERSKLLWEEQEDPDHRGILRLYRELLALRHQNQALAGGGGREFPTSALGDAALAIRRERGEEQCLILLNLEGELHLDFGERELTCAPAGKDWEVLLSSEEARFSGKPSAPGWRREGDRLRMPGTGALVLSAR